MATSSLQPIVRHIRQLAQAGPSLPDGDLLARFVAERDQAAFEALVRRHGSMVLGAAWRVLHDSDRAEDVFQATFLVLARHVHRLDRSGSIAGRLYTVAHRLALKAKADTRGRSGASSLDRAGAWSPDHAPARDRDPLAELTARELCGVLDEELQRLPEIYRLPLLLCCVEGKTRDEAARQLGWTTHQVKAGLERGRSRLKQRLARRGIALSAVLLTATMSQNTAVSAALCKATVALLAHPATPTIAALANAMSRTVLPNWVAILGLAMLTVGVGGLGLAMPERAEEAPAQTADTNSQEPATKREEVHTDRLGDPLPPDAIARLGTVRMRHGYMTYDAKFSPDGRFIASAGAGRGVCVWDAATGKEVWHALPKWSDHVYRLAFSADGSTLVGWQGGTILIWNAATGVETHRIENAGPGAADFAMSPDGKLIAAGGIDREVRILDTTSGEELAKLSGHEQGAYALAFSKDSKLLVTASHDETIRVWNVADRSERHRFAGSGVYGVAVAISPDSKLLAARGTDEKIHLWDPNTGKEVRVLESKREWSRCLAFAPDGASLAAGGSDGVVRLWDPIAGKLLRTWVGHDRMAVSSIAFSHDSKRLVTTAAWQSGPRVWDVATGKELLARPGHVNPVDQVALTPDGKSLVSYGRFEAILRWDLATGRIAQRISPSTAGPASVVLALDGESAATLERDSGDIRLWDLATGKEVRKIGKIAKHSGNLLPPCLAFSPDGRMLAAISEQKSVYVWEIAGNKEARRFTNAGQIDSVAFSADGKRLAAGRGGAESAVIIWDIERAAAVWFKKIGSREGQLAIALSPDGRRVATAAWRGGIQVWDIETKKELYTLADGERGAYQVAFSPDGRFLVATGNEYHPGVTVWEMATGQQVHQYTGHITGAVSVAFSPDCRRVASGGAESMIYLWDMTSKAQARDLEETDLESHWRDLASADASRAVTAVWELALSPRQAVPFLQTKLKRPEPVDAQQMKELIRNLDSDQFEVRAGAAKELERLREQAEPALRKALSDDPSPEMRKRLEQLLAKLEPGRSPERLREVRAVQALEYAATAEARQLLEQLAAGPPNVHLTREANAAVKRPVKPR